MAKTKFTLISLLAMCLTAGSVFAAWSFLEGSLENIEPVDTNVSTEGFSGFEFMHVTVKFDANGGAFPDGSTVQSLISKKYQAISADAYTTLFPDFSYFPTKNVDGEIYRFSNWSVGPKTTDYFSFDNGFDEDSTLYAQYVPATYPAIYKSTDTNFESPLGFFKVNSGTEYHLRNFIATGMKNHSAQNRGFHYVIKDGTNTYDIKASQSYTNNTHGYSFTEGRDYLVNGLYNIYFDPNKSPLVNDGSGDLGWLVYGGKAFFEPQYNYRLVGNPVASNSDDPSGWADPSPNPVTFKYVSTSANGLTKNYLIDRVDFPFYEGEATREFKPYIANFGFYPLRDVDYQDSDKLYPKMYHASDNTTKEHLTYASDSKGANLKLKSNSVITYRVTMSVTYEDRKPFNVTYDNSTTETYYSFNNYPVSMTVAMEPYEHKINVYSDKNAAEPSSFDVLSNSKWAEHDSAYPLKEYTDSIAKKYEGVAWKDIYTDKVIDFENININKSYHVYPVYDVVDATTYNLTLSVYENGAYADKVIPMFEGHTVQENVDYYLNQESVNTYDNIISKYLIADYNPDPFSATDSTLSKSLNYDFDSYVKGTSLNSTTKYSVSTILSTNITENITFKARYVSSTPVLKYHTANSSSSFAYLTTSSSNYISNERKEIYNYNNKGCQSNYWLLSYGFDSTKTTTNYNLITASGKYWPKLNGTTWEINRFFALLAFSTWKTDWWFGSGARQYVYAWNSNGNAWFSALSTSSGERRDFIIPYDYTSFCFVRLNNTNNAPSWSSAWNQTTDITFANSYTVDGNSVKYSHTYYYYKLWNSKSGEKYNWGIYNNTNS